MANRIETNRKRPVDPETLTFSPAFTSQTANNTPRYFAFDDLIVSLSDAYENRRARQVGEWERMHQPWYGSSVSA
jgi:hypothetical protein